MRPSVDNSGFGYGFLGGVSVAIANLVFYIQKSANGKVIFIQAAHTECFLYQPNMNMGQFFTYAGNGQISNVP